MPSFSLGNFSGTLAEEDGMQKKMRESARSMESEMDSDEVAFLKDLLAENNLKGTHVEIGTAAGGTLCAMMRSFGTRKCPKFVVVDPMTYFPDQLDVVRKNLQVHELDSNDVDFRVVKSNEALQKAQSMGESFDFILIDAAHKIRHVMHDLKWAELLNSGGLLCLHDYCDAHKGVVWAVDRFLRKNPHFVVEKLVNRLIVLRKSSSREVRVSTWDSCWAAFWSLWLQWEVSLRKRLYP
jgi:predicted O-methyltransferase YrrM